MAIGSRSEEIETRIRRAVREELRAVPGLRWFKDTSVSWGASFEVHSILPFDGYLWIHTGWTPRLYAMDVESGRVYEVYRGDPEKEMFEGWGKLYDDYYAWKHGAEYIGAFIVEKGMKATKLPPYGVYDNRPVYGGYWAAKHLSDPGNKIYVGGYDEGIFEVSIPDKTMKKVADYPQSDFRSRGAVAVGSSRLMIGSRYGLYTWSPSEGFVKRLDGLWHGMLRFGDYLAVGVDLDAPSGLFAVTSDGINYSVQRLPIPQRYGGASLDGFSERHNMIGYVPWWGAMANCWDIFWVVRPGSTAPEPIGSLPISVGDFATFGDLIALATNIYPYEPSTHAVAGVMLLRWKEFAEVLMMPPAFAYIWRNRSVSAGKYSQPVVVSGWSNITLSVVSNTSGNLSIEADVAGDNSWEALDTVPITANTPTQYVINAPVARIRISFSANATVTAKVFAR